MFADLATEQLEFLLDDHGFVNSTGAPDRVVYDTDRTRVEVSSEYHLVSVVISSREPEVIRRLHVGMLDLVELKAPGLKPDYPPGMKEYNRDPAACVERQLRILASLLKD